MAKVTANIRKNLVVPRTPNFLRYGDAEYELIHVSDLSREDLQKIGAAWTKNLITKSRKLQTLPEG